MRGDRNAEQSHRANMEQKEPQAPSGTAMTCSADNTSSKSSGKEARTKESREQGNEESNLLTTAYDEQQQRGTSNVQKSKV